MSLENEPQICSPQPATEQAHRINQADMITITGIGLAAVAAPNFDKWWGITLGIAAYGADGIDGWWARKTGQTSEFGAKLDATADKSKIAWAVYNTWENDQAPKTLLALITGYNAVNAAITIADRKLNVEPQVAVNQPGKKAMRLSIIGLAGSIIGNKVTEKSPALGRALIVGGAALATFGVMRYGKDATKGYWDAFKSGERKPPKESKFLASLSPEAKQKCEEVQRRLHGHKAV